MCTNIKFIRNKYLHYTIPVKCGKCKACLQEKANMRALRIQSTYSSDCTTMFVTLSYENRFVPYVRYSELLDFFNGERQDFSIYRDATAKRFRNYGYMYVSKLRGKGNKKVHVKNQDGSNFYRFDRKIGSSEIVKTFTSKSDLVNEDFYDSLLKSFDKFTTIRKKVGYNKFVNIPDKIAVCYYPDFQKFMKRFRKAFFVHYNYDSKLSYFVTSEYGETYQRCHFHVLFFINRGFAEKFKWCLSENWTYADFDFIYRRTEFARKPANYVSSYVNCGSELPPFFKTFKPFQAVWHYSQGFGVNYFDFQLPQVLEKIRNRDIFYIVERVQRGNVTRTSLPLPYYVLNRYFPKFKGYTRCSSSNVHAIIRRAVALSEHEELGTDLRFMSFLLGLGLRDYNKEDSHKVRVMLFNKFKECEPVLKMTGSLSPLDDFCIYFTDAWKVRQSNLIKSQHVDTPDVLELYDNIGQNIYKNVRHEYLDNYIRDFHIDRTYIECDPNRFKCNVDKTKRLEDLYNKRVKQRRVTAVTHMDL